MKTLPGLFLTLLLLFSDAVYSEEVDSVKEESQLPPGAKRTITPMVLSTQPLTTGYTNLAVKESSLESKLKTLEGLHSGLRVEDDTMKLKVIFESDIFFDFDKHSLRADAEKVLQSVAQILQSLPQKSITIIGHTDNVGSNTYNKKLSQKRAESVKSWMEKRSELRQFSLKALGRGEEQPIAPNTLPSGDDNPEGRQKNRRVELEIPK
jgi:outer membrane protein OmpA-like peptidoglycan-associated protein